MSGTVRGDPERLEAYTEATELAIDRAIAAVEEYSRAIAAFNTARPNDLGTNLPDLGPQLLERLEVLREFNRRPAAFAFALRNLDRLGPLVPWYLEAGIARRERVEALATAWLRDPDRPDAEIVSEAGGLLDRTLDWPWESGDDHGPLFWSSAAIGTATDTVVHVERRLVVPVREHVRANGTRVAAHWRWRPGHAQRLNPITQARTAGRLAPMARRAAPWVAPVFAGVEQISEDWGDESLTKGDRIARTSMTAATEGGGAWAGALAGAQLGAMMGAAGGPIGVAVGGVVGAAFGGWLGGEAGATLNENMDGVTESIGAGFDAIIGPGGAPS